MWLNIFLERYAKAEFKETVSQLLSDTAVDLTANPGEDLPPSHLHDNCKAQTLFKHNIKRENS